MGADDRESPAVLPTRAAEAGARASIEALGTTLAALRDSGLVQRERGRELVRKSAARIGANAGLHRRADALHRRLAADPVDSPPDRLSAALLEAAPHAVVITDRAGRIALANRQAERLTGYAREELAGLPVELLVPERSRDAREGQGAGASALPRSWATGAGLELAARRKDGTDVPVEVSLSPLELGGELLLVNVVRDVTEQRRALDDLARQAAALREQAALLELSPDGIFARDIEGSRITYWSRGAEALYGWPRAEALGRVSHELLRTAFPAPLGEIEAELLARGRWEGELVHRRKGGREVAVASRWALLRDDDGWPLAILEVNTDVTARHELERQKDEFLSNVSHDLRTPLAAIKASIGVILANEPAATPGPIRRLHANVDAAATRMATLVEDLLELTRLQGGRLALRLERADLGALARRAAQGVEPLAASRGQRLEVALPVRAVWATVDPERLERAVLNLVGNAQKHGREGGAIRVSVSLRARGKEAWIAVADDGPGIPPEERGRIFERYYRPDGEDRSPAGGTGLGLPIARGIAELHGGRLWVESAVGVGSTFTLAVPRRPRAGAVP